MCQTSTMTCMPGLCPTPAQPAQPNTAHACWYIPRSCCYVRTCLLPHSAADQTQQPLHFKSARLVNVQLTAHTVQQVRCRRRRTAAACSLSSALPHCVHAASADASMVVCFQLTSVQPLSCGDSLTLLLMPPLLLLLLLCWPHLHGGSCKQTPGMPDPSLLHLSTPSPTAAAAD